MQRTKGQVRAEDQAHGQDSETPRMAGIKSVVYRLVAPDSPFLLMAVMAVIVAFFAVMLSDTGFLTLSNMMSIVRATTMVSVMAVALVFVLSVGEIDLSIASVPPVAGYIVALLLRADAPVVVAIVLAILFGALVGLINGGITVWFGVPSFIVTIGMIGVLEGVGRLITGRVAVPIDNSVFTTIFGSGNVGPIPVLLLWTLGIGAIGWYGLKFTAFGRAVLATGANRVAARYSGIRTNRIRLMALMISGMGGALAGVLYSGFLHTSRYDLGGDQLLTVLAAVIIGGTALMGGRGNIWGAVAGSLLLGLLNNGVILLGFDTAQQRLVRGAIIVIAVILASKQVELNERLRHWNL